MPSTDRVSDMLTRMRNAIMAGQKTVSFPAASLKQEICRILQQEKFIRKFVVVDDGMQGTIKVLLKYKAGQSVINGLVRVSKPGRRVYCKATAVPRVLSGMGIAVLSTPLGVVTDSEAKAKHVGGEVLCKVW
jgi:small subunit ribosomal protein S8